MIHGGLVSITFRQLDPVRIVELVKESGLSCIEWGGDVHVPHGDIRIAGEVKNMMSGEGLMTAAYGSYYKVGESEVEGLAFGKVLDSAVALGSPLIRVWAGSQGSADANDEQWGLVIEDGVRIAEMAREAGKEVSFEFHNSTLTDHAASATKLVDSIGAENVSLYWQPLDHAMPGDPMDDLTAVANYMHHVHVFSWVVEAVGGPVVRHELAGREDRWRGYFEKIAAVEGDRCAMIEFVKGDEPGQFLEDAQTLKRWISG